MPRKKNDHLEVAFAGQLDLAGIAYTREERLIKGRRFCSDFIFRDKRGEVVLTAEVDGDVFASYNFSKGHSKKAFGGHDGSGKIRDCRKEALLLCLGIPTIRAVKQTIQDGSTLNAVRTYLFLNRLGKPHHWLPPRASHNPGTPT